VYNKTFQVFCCAGGRGNKKGHPLLAFAPASVGEMIGHAVRIIKLLFVTPTHPSASRSIVTCGSLITSRLMD
jgi:hypothetical protein